MGSEERIDTMLSRFRLYFEIPLNAWPQFNREDEYYMIQKGNADHEMIADAWEFFKNGWVSRELVDEDTVEGW